MRTFGSMSELRIGLIGGSGLARASSEASSSGTRHEINTPFGRPSDAIVETEWSGIKVMLLSRHGPGHTLNPSHVPYRANIFALKELGCTHILASGAVGSLREEYKPRHLVIPDQLIDRTHQRANTFFERAAVHVEFAEPFCPVLRQILMDAAKDARAERTDAPTPHVALGEHGEAVGTPPDPALEATAPQAEAPEPLIVHDRGCYVAMEGAAFSTRAESLMHRLWGGDLIGMTASPEAKLAREAEIPYALVALVTDYDCWRHKSPHTDAAKDQESPDPHLLLKEIIGHLQVATANALRLMRQTVAIMAERRDLLATCPARHALELAIWSDKGSIPPDEIRRLAPLWGRYFDPQAASA